MSMRAAASAVWSSSWESMMTATSSMLGDVGEHILRPPSEAPMTHVEMSGSGDSFYRPLAVGRTPRVMASHDVQFYRTNAFLVREVVNFLAQGLRAGQPLVIIATEPHRRAFADGLRALGLDT